MLNFPTTPDPFIRRLSSDRTTASPEASGSPSNPLDSEQPNVTRFDVFALFCDSHRIIVHQLYLL